MKVAPVAAFRLLGLCCRDSCLLYSAGLSCIKKHPFGIGFAPVLVPFAPKMKVSATLKGSLDSIGRRKVYIRIADRYTRKFFATNIWIDPKQWSKGKVINHADSKNLNQRIKDLILSTEVSPVQKTDLYFYKYALDCLNRWEHTKKQSTLNQLRSKIKKFRDFSDSKLSHVTSALLTKYVNHCYSLGNQENTVWTSLKAVRVIINQALKDRAIIENPFLSFTMPRYRDPQKVYLSKPQVEKIEKFAFKETPYRIAAAWFVIACYTGLRFSDQVNFNKGKIRDGRLIIYTSKTGQVVSIPVNEKLKKLFRLVGYKPLPYTNEHYNRLLKAIAAVCKIKLKLSTHTARHSFGTLCASAGISQEVTAKLLGHSSIRVTAIYYQLTGTKIDSEFEKLF